MLSTFCGEMHEFSLLLFFSLGMLVVAQAIISLTDDSKQ